MMIFFTAKSNLILQHQACGPKLAPGIGQ